MDCIWKQGNYLQHWPREVTLHIFSRFSPNSAQPRTEIISLLLHWTTQDVSTLLLPFFSTKWRHGIWGVLSGPASSEISMWRGSFKMWCTQVVLVTWGLCSTEEDLLYSHKCPSLIKLHTEIPRKHMSKSGQCDSAVKAAAAQGLVALELQLWGTLLHSTPLQHLKNKSRSRTRYEQRAYNVRNYFLGSTMLILGERKLCLHHPAGRTNITQKSGQMCWQNPSRTWTCCNAPRGQDCCRELSTVHRFLWAYNTYCIHTSCIS